MSLKIVRVVPETKQPKISGWKVISDTVIELRYTDGTSLRVQEKDFRKHFSLMLKSKRKSVKSRFSI